MKHARLRLAYENQMLEAQGGRAAFVEMVPGGFIGSKQIQKVNKSPATGRVVSVQVWGESQYTKEKCLLNLNIERLKSDIYRAPTPEEKQAFEDEKKAQKKEQAKAPKGPSLINPTPETAQKLQDVWNSKARAKWEKLSYKTGEFEPEKVLEIPQAVYSVHSKGAYAKAETKHVCASGEIPSRHHLWEPEAIKREEAKGPILCKVRTTYGKAGFSNCASRVIVITDKPQKPLPEAVTTPKTEAETVAA